MASKTPKVDKKVEYEAKLCKLLDDYTKILIASANNVRSTQLQNIRKGFRLRGDSVLLMGKNKTLKKIVKDHAEKTHNQDLLNLIPLIEGNVGLIFTNGDLKEVNDEVAKHKVKTPTLVDMVSPCDVVLLPGNTGLDPSQTSLFQVLNIPTEINNGTVEITAQFELIKRGDKVGSSEADLLAKLGISPYSHGLRIVNVYDNGVVSGPEVIEDPSKFVFAAAPGAAAGGAAAPGAAAGGAAANEEENVEETAEESDDDMGLGQLFLY